MFQTPHLPFHICLIHVLSVPFLELPRATALFLYCWTLFLYSSKLESMILYLTLWRLLFSCVSLSIIIEDVPGANAGDLGAA